MAARAKKAEIVTITDYDREKHLSEPYLHEGDPIRVTNGFNFRYYQLTGPVCFTGFGLTVVEGFGVDLIRWLMQYAWCGIRYPAPDRPKTDDMKARGWRNRDLPLLNGGAALCNLGEVYVQSLIQLEVGFGLLPSPALDGWAIKVCEWLSYEGPPFSCFLSLGGFRPVDCETCKGLITVKEFFRCRLCGIPCCCKCVLDSKHKHKGPDVKRQWVREGQEPLENSVQGGL